MYRNRLSNSSAINCVQKFFKEFDEDVELSDQCCLLSRLMPLKKFYSHPVEFNKQGDICMSKLTKQNLLL